jgi:hypothetical protein
MSAIVDALFQLTDPVTALLLIGILYHVSAMREELRQEIARNRERVERIESTHIDG